MNRKEVVDAIRSGALERYLGDGLYANWDGYQITLRAPREGGDHHVALEPPVLRSFKEYAKKIAKIRADLIAQEEREGAQGPTG